MELEILEKKLNYRFKDRELLKLALTHSSFTKEKGTGYPNNQRLEFLGDDALLEVTPENLRIRKKILDHTIRGRETFRKKQELKN